MDTTMTAILAVLRVIGSVALEIRRHSEQPSYSDLL
jgi:hypothetical protein